VWYNKIKKGKTMMAKTPTAPPSAVNEIVRTLRGQWYPTEARGYTTAQFASRTDLTNALHLLNMLGGWSAEVDPDQKMTLRVSSEAQ